MAIQFATAPSNHLEDMAKRCAEYLLYKKAVFADCKTPDDTLFVLAKMADTIAGRFILVDSVFASANTLSPCELGRPRHNCLTLSFDQIKTHGTIFFEYGCVGWTAGNLYFNDEGWIRDAYWGHQSH